jgi:hypothetical protein
MNRRSFLRYLGIGAASVVPAVASLASLKLRKPVRATIDLGREGRLDVREVIDCEGNVIPGAWRRETKGWPWVEVSEDVPAHRLLTVAADGKMRGAVGWERGFAVSGLPARAGELTPVRFFDMPARFFDNIRKLP